MLNRNELRAAFARKGYTQQDVAAKLGITGRTMTAKMQKGVFKSDEIYAMIDFLDITDPMPIFFAK